MLKNLGGRQLVRIKAIGMTLLLAAVLTVALSRIALAQDAEIDQNSEPLSLEPAPETTPLANPDALTGSTKLVDLAEAPINTTLSYTVVISNSDVESALDVVLTDTLPVALAYVADSLAYPEGSSGLYDSGVITWTGIVSPQAQALITFQATLVGDLEVDDVVTNTVVIEGNGVIVTRRAETTVIAAPDPEPEEYFTYLPLTFASLPYVTLNPIPRPNANNQWVLTWVAAGSGATGYEVHESQDPGFATYTSYSVGLTNSALVTQTPAPNNEYYYRVRATGTFGNGPWSNVQHVIGGYRDDFDDAGTGWTVRRTSLWVPDDYEKHPRSTYVAGGYLELMMNDRWDWFVTSPLRQAPELPYVLEYRAQLVKGAGVPPNLVSHGPILGGDWDMESCPEIGNVYETDNCFNHFYNFNIIYHGPLKMLFERVDYLQFCPTCGGAALKRLSNDYSVWFEVGGLTDNEPIPNWHTYRIEVRDTGLTFYIDGAMRAQSPDASWVNERYFGLFASTDEYRPSHWYVDYYQITPLDQ